MNRPHIKRYIINKGKGAVVVWGRGWEGRGVKNCHKSQLCCVRFRGSFTEVIYFSDTKIKQKIIYIFHFCTQKKTISETDCLLRRRFLLLLLKRQKTKNIT